MTRHEIVADLARDEVVERIARFVAKSPVLTPDLQDLCQLVYLILLEYDEDKVVDLYECGALRFFIARVLTNQYKTSNSAFHRQIRKFSAQSVDIWVNSTLKALETRDDMQTEL